MHHVDRALLSPHSNFIIEKRDGTENARHDKSARWILKAKQKNRNKEESAGGVVEIGRREEGVARKVKARLVSAGLSCCTVICCSLWRTIVLHLDE